MADFLFSSPKPAPSGPSPEQIRQAQLEQQRIAEAQRAEQLRIEAENQRRANIQRAAHWRARMDRVEEEMTEQLGGAFDVIRKGPSTNAFGTGNADVSIGDDGAVTDDNVADTGSEATPLLDMEAILRLQDGWTDTSVVDLRGTDPLSSGDWDLRDAPNSRSPETVKGTMVSGRRAAEPPPIAGGAEKPSEAYQRDLEWAEWKAGRAWERAVEVGRRGWELGKYLWEDARREENPYYDVHRTGRELIDRDTKVMSDALDDPQKALRDQEKIRKDAFRDRIDDPTLRHEEVRRIFTGERKD